MTDQQPPQREVRRTANDLSMLKATLIALVLALILDVIVLVIAGVTYGSAQLAGALVGTLLTLVVVLPTVATALMAPRLGAAGSAGMMFGGWGLKMVVVVLTIILLRDAEAIDLLWLAIALTAGALVAVAVETILLVRLRQPLNVISQ